MVRFLAEVARDALEAYDADDVARLEAEMTALRRLLNARPASPREWELSPLEENVAYVLATRRAAQASSIVRQVYRDKPLPAQPLRNVYVFMYRLRRKLERLGVLVTHEQNVGYAVTAGREILRRGFGLEDADAA